MSNVVQVTQEEIDRLYDRLNREAETSGYHLNPDVAFTKELLRGLLVNQKRYGYSTCPCRLASGNRSEDADIICPCVYRDADLNEYGACYCALYVSGAALRGEKPIVPIPERRGSRPEMDTSLSSKVGPEVLPKVKLPVWRCQVCGYLCAREHPPETCPICKAKQDRFERFL